ncbi:chromatin associated protein KTI12 [Paraphysoderma sedebokerense]|nr:chromatin associated protein KTI12 [Paraphysoderma sedebokerense]
MPLIILCGIPCSSKTTRANQLKEYFTANPQMMNGNAMTIHIINDESLRVDKATAYKTQFEEKKARAAYISAVERLLSPSAIVIVDGMNYIKGYRYQLYCIARAISTPHCVIHCGVPVDKARIWNSKRDNGYDSNTFDELVTRFEEPDSKNRWDSPLFTSLWDDESLQFKEIVDAVILRKPPPPNLSTVVKPVSETNYLYELDKTTQDIINAILEAQKSGLGGPGALITVPRSKLKVSMPSQNVTLSELRRHRKQFTNVNKFRTLIDMDKIADTFVEWLNTNFND